MRSPSPSGAFPVPWSEWHYWWQAHYLDALLDSAQRRGRTSSGLELRRAGALLRGIRLRNGLRLANSYYDDMAWLALAAGRLDSLASASGATSPGPSRRAVQVLGRRLDRGRTEDLGGGLFWSTKRDFKNTPATAPAALFLVRHGRPAPAQALLDWLHGTLFDAATGLYLDGIKILPTGTETERGIYSYNQGTVLGALVELGGAANLRRAADLISAVEAHLTEDGPAGTRVLTLSGSGDGGLFTGILARYLGVAVLRTGLDARARETAVRLVLDTAESLWQARSAVPFLRFPASHSEPAARTYPPDAAVELSTQLQAWMTLECACRLASPDALG
jgi:predicted alpha-1,6-mannanase (GH76 family)